MSDLHIAANPFGMMINPEAILDAMNRSDRLERLQRRVYRPLDKPMIPKVGAAPVADLSEDDLDDMSFDSVADSLSMTDMSDVLTTSERNLAY